MKYTIFTTSALLATLTTTLALPTSDIRRRQIGSQDDVTIVIKTGDGDSASTASGPLQVPIIPTTFNAVRATVNDQNVWCAAFADMKAEIGIIPRTGPAAFDSNDAAVYSLNPRSDRGGTGAQSEDSITVASYWCSASEQRTIDRVTRNSLTVFEVKAQTPSPEGAGNVTPPQNNRINNGNFINNNNNINNNNDNDNDNGQVVRIQVDGQSEESRQGNTDANGVINAGTNGFSDEGLRFSIVSGNARECTAFSGPDGTGEPVGSPATARVVGILQPVGRTNQKFGSIVCE